jgi:hypothetical protein
LCFLLLLFVSSFKPKQEKDKEKDKGIPCVMCITNDDVTRNDIKHNDVMKKRKCLKRENEDKKKKEMMKL